MLMRGFPLSRRALLLLQLLVLALLAARLTCCPGRAPAKECREAIRSTRPQTADELAKAKSYSVGQFGLGLETSSAVLSALVDLEVYGMPTDLLDTYRSRVDEVTVANTDQVAQALLHPDRAAIVLLGPAETLKPQFESLGTVEVVDPD